MKDPQTDSPENKLVGVLLTNIGSPDAPTPDAVRRYLREFLSDRRIIDYPRWMWFPILYGIILPVRAKKSARLYQSIWDQDSPLLVTMTRLRDQLQQHFDQQGQGGVRIQIGMTYGSPSIAEGLRTLRQADAEKIILLPLFPQYSSTTTAATLDAVRRELNTWSSTVEIETIDHYYDNSGYLDAVADSIREAWKTHEPPERLLFSFHGVPLRYLEGTDDPYRRHCLETADKVAQRLGIPDYMWQVAFQSKFGPGEWLTPATTETLSAWAQSGHRRVDVVCPGFSVECLETLHEIDHEARQIFLDHGGQAFHYIPALNDRPEHVTLLAKLILERAGG